MASGIARGRIRTTDDDDDGGGVAQHGGHTPIIDWQRHAALVYRVLLWYRTSMLWSTDTCQNKVSADQYHVTISQAQVYNSSRSRVFFKVDRWPNDGFSIGSRAHVRLTCLKPGRIVWKPANASPGLKFIQIITFSPLQFFLFAAALFYVYKIQNRKPHRKVTKLKSKFTFSWVSLIGFLTTWPEGATLLGWPKSIYYNFTSEQPKKKTTTKWLLSVYCHK